MKKANFNCLSSPTGASATGNQLDTNQWVSCSFHIYCASTAAGGVLKIQASNDPNPEQYAPSDFPVANWVDVPSANVTVSSGAPGLITINQCNTRWLRPIYTASTGTVDVEVNVFALSV